MKAFRIVQIVADQKQVYIRRETVGSSTIGGDDTIPYDPCVVKEHFSNMLHHNNTSVDRAISSAKVVETTVLCDLKGTVGQADAVKAYEVKQAQENGLYTVLNVK